MKFKFTLPKFLFLVLLAFCAATTNAQSVMVDSTKAHSNAFKALNGGSREALFVNHLYNAIRVWHPHEHNTTTSNLMGAQFTTKAEVRLLLGNPNYHMPDAIDEYYLSPSPTTNKLIIVYNANNIVISVAIKN